VLLCVFQWSKRTGQTAKFRYAWAPYLPSRVACLLTLMRVTFVVEVPSNILDTRVTGVHAKQTDSTNASAFIAAGNRRRQGQFASCRGFAAIEKDRLETLLVNVASEFLEATLGPLHLLATDCTDALRTDALRNAAADVVYLV